MILDPRTKLVMVICFSTLALVFAEPVRLGLLLACTIILLLVFKVDLAGVGRNLRPFWSLFLILFIVQVVFTPGGEVLVRASGVPLLTSQGLAGGISVVLRIGVVIASATLLTTVKARDLILGLVQWKVPYEIAFMVFIAIRFLPLFREEISNVVTAVQLRGIELDKVPWGEKIALYRRLFFPVVYGAILKAQQLAVAMEARGFRAYPRRTYLRHLELGRADYAMILFFSGATLIILKLNAA